MKYRMTEVLYDLESYEEIIKLVDAGEMVECRCWVDEQTEADFVVMKNDDGEYVVNESYPSPIRDHDLEDFTLKRFVR